MSTALVTMQPNGAALVSPDLAERRRLLSDLIMRNGSEAQVDLVMHLCGHYGLDPLLKHLVLINGSAYITRDGLLHIAHQSGQFDGIEVALAKLDDDEWSATCTVYRKDKTRPFRYTVYQREHQQAGGAWQKFPRAMLAKTAEVACLRRAFDVSLGAVEELGYDGQSSASHIGDVAEIAEGSGFPSWSASRPTPLAQPHPPHPPQRPARIALPAGKIDTWDDDALLTVCGGEYPPAQVRRALTVYLDRATTREELSARALTANRAGAEKALLTEVARLVYAGLKAREPGAYQHHSRADQQPVLGETPDERMAMLARIRAAMAAAGKDEAQVNAFVYATWKQPAIETLSAAEAEELIAILEARGDEEEAAAPAEAPARYPDDGDPVPF